MDKHYRYSNKQDIRPDYSYTGTRNAETIMGSVADLIDDPKYRPWFFSCLYKLGPQRFLDIAEAARKTGLEKGRFFTKLLRDASK